MVKGSICGRVGSEGARSNTLTSWVVVVRYFESVDQPTMLAYMSSSVGPGFNLFGILRESVNIFGKFPTQRGFFARQHLTPVCPCLLRVWTYCTYAHEIRCAIDLRVFLFFFFFCIMGFSVNIRTRHGVISCTFVVPNTMAPIDCLDRFFCFACKSQTDEIHVDILNAHLQFVTPFLKQHGVEYERDRFTEKLDAGEISLDMTHLWLHRAIRQLRIAAAVTPAAATAVAAAPMPAAGTSSVAPVVSPPPPPVSPEILFYRQLLSDLEQKRGDAYLKLLRVAIVDNLLGAIVRVERKSGSSPPTASSASGGSVANAASKKEGGAAAAASATGESARDDQQEDMLEGVAVPETLMLDRYRLVVIAAGAEQAAYTASLVAFARQALAVARVPLVRGDEDRVRDALMVLFETEDVTSVDICAQVTQTTGYDVVCAFRIVMPMALSIFPLGCLIVHPHKLATP